ncbi:MAG: Fic family protein [Desulfobacterales bacterium]|nr:Fic family protein [Desulfobacterales bacterium]
MGLQEMLSFKINDVRVKELRELAQNTARKHQIVLSMDREELDYIQRNTQISAIGASTRIENAILTDAEVDWLDTILAKDARTTAYLDRREFIQDKLSRDKERSIDEVSGCRAMLHLITTQANDFFPLSETIVRAFHNELLQYYVPSLHYRGRYKTSPNSVIRRNKATGEETSVLETSPPGIITESAMRDLIIWYNDTLPSNPWTVAVATEFVFRFLAMHPFQDGNGRLGRGLFLLALLQSPDESLCVMTPFIPIDRHIEKQREDYYITLRRCSGGKFNADPIAYEYDHFLGFMLKTISRSLDDFEFYRERYRALHELPPTAVEVLNCFKERPELRLQRRIVIENTGLPRTTVTDALRILKEQGFIQRLGRGSGIRYQLIF